MSVLGSLITGGATLGGSILTNIFQNSRIRDQRRYDQMLMRQQNSYNSPAAQVQRMKSAGLNPSLMYGNLDTGNTSPIEGQVVNPVDFGSAMSNALNTSLISSQQQLNESAAAKNQAEAQEAGIRSSQSQEQFPLILQQLSEELGKTKEERKVLSEQVTNLQEQTNNLKASFELIMNNADLIKSQERLNNLNYAEGIKKWKFIDDFATAQINSLYASAESSKGFGSYMNSMAQLNWRSMTDQLRYRTYLADNMKWQSDNSFWLSLSSSADYRAKTASPTSTPTNRLEQQLQLSNSLLSQQIETYSFNRFMDSCRFKLDQDKFTFEKKQWKQQLTFQYINMAFDFIGKEQQIMVDGFKAVAPLLGFL